MNYPNTRLLTEEYLRRQIENASPAQQLVLLYDGAMKFCLQAKDAIGRSDIDGRHKANRKAMEIIGYLMEILDMDKGGEVAVRLQRIYSHLIKKLMEVDFKNSTLACDEVVGHLRTLRASWNQLAEQGIVPQPGQPAMPQSPQGAGSGDGNPPVLPVRRSAMA